MEMYEECPQLYGESQPGLGSVLKAAVMYAGFAARTNHEQMYAGFAARTNHE
jgi:hypothetical protein